MNLHEHQAKLLLNEFGVPIPKGIVANTVGEACDAINALGGERWVVKAQVHAGGRGKAGGVKIVSSKEEIQDFANSLLHTKLVTNQTTAEGQPINQLLIEEPLEIAKELYLSAIVDSSCSSVIFIASTEGGVDIEKVAAATPEKILTTMVNPTAGILPFQCRELAFKLGLSSEQIKQFTHILTCLYEVFISNDLAMLEINPLVIKSNDELICLDCKVKVDENSLYRLPKLREMRDLTQEDDKEVQAKLWDLNYIALDGDIGCMVNGAGLAMATMDLIKYFGGSPANFLDVGGGATKERVAQAFKIILSDAHVKAVLVNIFGGIVRCDLIAEGVLAAVAEVGIEIPVIVRLEGNRADIASEILENSKLKVIVARSLKDAAEQAIKAAGEA